MLELLHFLPRSGEMMKPAMLGHRERREDIFMGLTGGVELRPRNEGNGGLEEEIIGRVKVTLGLVAAIRNWYPESVRSDNTTPYKTSSSG